MARRRRRGRIYWRERGDVPRAYADFRDLGGGREALVAPGQKLATTDPLVAEKLVANRLQELQAMLRDCVLLGVERRVGLKEFAAHHLVEKARAGRVTEKHLGRMQLCLERAVEFFGAARDLTGIGPADIGQWVSALREFVSPISKRPLSDQSVRQHLVALSNLYRRAQSEGCVLPGFNPVASLMDKPTPTRREARWLEVHEAALLLESARTYKPPSAARVMGPLYPIIATLLLSGGRRSEVLGLEVDDVSFDRKVVTFRPNTWRRLKTVTSHRSVPLWPQLEEILRQYVFDGNGPLGSLLFPSVRCKPESMITDLRKSLDAIGERVGWRAGNIRTKMFRHSYCAARLQTLDRGAPVSEFTVARELGHGGRAMVERVYGHLGQIRHRSEVVEYRVEQHRDVIGERLVALEASTRSSKSDAHSHE